MRSLFRGVPGGIRPPLTIGSEREYSCQKLCSVAGVTKGTVSHHVRELLQAVHGEGGKIVPQLWHVGNVRRLGTEPDAGVPGYGPMEKLKDGQVVVHGMTQAEAARLFGATEEEIVEASLMAKNTMGWSTYLNTMQFDYDAFVEEFDQTSEITLLSRCLPILAGGEVTGVYPEYGYAAASVLGSTLNFQTVADFARPQWPGQEHPQQFHLDLRVIDATERGRAAKRAKAGAAPS